MDDVEATTRENGGREALKRGAVMHGLVWLKRD
jgi:hypothetical protein